jgi:hypothetical protein
LIGQVLTNEEKIFLYKLHIIEKSYITKPMTIKQIYSGKLKKADVIIEFNTKHLLGISYKQNMARTIQSWTNIQSLDLIFGRNNLRKISRFITKQVNEKYIHQNFHNSEKLFLSATFHISNNKTKTNDRLIDVINLSDTIVRKLYFGHENDRSNCRLVFQSEDYNIIRLMDIFNHKNCNSINDIDILKNKLYIDIRFPFVNKSASNNSSQMLSMWAPNKSNKMTNPIKIQTRSDCHKHGEFIPFYEWLGPSTNYKSTNTNNLIKEYFNYGFVFPKLQPTTKYYTKYILNHWNKITGSMSKLFISL